MYIHVKEISHGPHYNRELSHIHAHIYMGAIYRQKSEHVQYKSHNSCFMQLACVSQTLTFESPENITTYTMYILHVSSCYSMSTPYIHVHPTTFCDGVHNQYTIIATCIHSPLSEHYPRWPYWMVVRLHTTASHRNLTLCGQTERSDICNNPLQKVFVHLINAIYQQAFTFSSKVDLLSESIPDTIPVSSLPASHN